MSLEMRQNGNEEDLLLRLARSRMRMDDAYADALSVDVLAREAGLSPYHFLRVFARAFGVTPGRYLTRVRVARAKEHLARGASVTEACFAVGFSSVGSFSALFAREVCCTPSIFQRQVRTFGSVPERLIALYVPSCFMGYLQT